MITYGLPEWLVICVAIIGFFMLAFGFLLIIDGYCPRNRKLKKIIGFALFIIGIIMFFGTMFTLTSLTSDSLAIDENGIWHGKGCHIFKSLTVVPLKGSIPITTNKELLYNLTAEEVILLARGSHFPERLREEITIRYEGYNVTLENVPQGVDPSHLKLVISFNPVFL